MDWYKWLDVFQVAMMSKFSISITELAREANQQNPKVRPIIGDFDEYSAIKKIISVMYLLGEAAREQFMDKYLNSALWELNPQQLIKL